MNSSSTAARGLAPVGHKKASLTNGKTSKMSGYTAGTNSAQNRDKFKTALERDRNKFHNDIYFLLETSR